MGPAGLVRLPSSCWLVFWDPRGIERYAALDISNGVGYYITTRAGRLGDAGVDVVTAAYFSIHPDFIRVSHEVLDLPGICDELASMSGALWDVADSLPLSGRPLFAAQLRHRRSDEPLLDAWLAVNCIPEWRGDTHWEIQIADGLTGTEAGVLDGAWRSYGEDWLPRSRGADDAALVEPYAGLERRGFAADGAVTEGGVAHRQVLEDRLDDMTAAAWRHLDAGEEWMPAGRRHSGIDL